MFIYLSLDFSQISLILLYGYPGCFGVLLIFFAIFLFVSVEISLLVAVSSWSILVLVLLLLGKNWWRSVLSISLVPLLLT